MENKFTPGPWSFEYDDNGFHYVTAKGMPSPYISATGGESTQDEANARLIASAPDLLKALQEMTNIYILLSMTYPELGDKNGYFPSFKDAMQAIAKATQP